MPIKEVRVQRELITHPKFVTKAVHDEVLQLLNKELREIVTGNFSVAEWRLAMAGHQPVMEIYLEKAGEPITIDECSEIHHKILDSESLNYFPQNVEIQVSSRGAEPFIRKTAEFEQTLGIMLSVETWESVENRSKYVMVCTGLNEAKDCVMLKEGSKVYSIPLLSIKYAQALYFHPGSTSSPSHGSKKSGKKR